MALMIPNSNCLCFLSQGLAVQRENQGNTVFVVRGPKGDKDIGDIQILTEIPSTLVGTHSEGISKAQINNLSNPSTLVGTHSERISKAQMDILSKDTIVKAKGLETQTPIKITDHEYIFNRDSNVSDDIGENLTAIETNDEVNAEAVLKNLNIYQRSSKSATAWESLLHACKYCDKLFGNKSDCKKHEKTMCGSSYIMALTEISEKEALVPLESGVGENKKELEEVRMNKNITGGKTVATDSTACVEDLLPKATSQSSKRVFDCPHCPQKLKGPIFNLYNHIGIVHQNIRPHSCEVCKKPFSNGRDLRNHEIAVHTRKCDGCGNYVAETEPWAEGVMKHHERNVVCGNCFKAVVFFSGSRIHLSQGSGALKSKVTPNKGKKQKSVEEKQTFACEVCNKLFGSLADCQEHKDKHDDRQCYMCQACGRQFKHARTLREHRKIHDDSYVPSHCTMCNKDFEQRRSFVLHMLHKHGVDASDEESFGCIF